MQTLAHKTKKLTNKQKRFIAEYIKNGLNGTQAALKAYPKQTYMSARQQATDNLAKPHINNEIQRALDELDATPRNSIRNIVQVANMEVDSKSATNVLRANELILELHGWKRNDKPNTTLNVSNFYGTKKLKDDANSVIDV